MDSGISVFSFVRHHLAFYREEGLEFLEAWTRALQAIPRGPQIEVARERKVAVEILRWSRPAWEAAYRGAPLADVLTPSAEPPQPSDLRAERALELVG